MPQPNHHESSSASLKPTESALVEKKASLATGPKKTCDEVIRQAVQTLGVSLPGSRVAFLTPESKGNLRVRAYSGYAVNESNTLRLKASGGVADQAARDLKPQRIAALSRQDAKSCLSPDTRSVMAVPVLYFETLQGVLNIEHPRPNAFTDTDLELVVSQAESLAPMLANYAAEDQIKQQMERQKMLYEITNKIRQSVDFNTIMHTSVEVICTTLDLPSATIRVNPAALFVSNTPSSVPSKELPQ
jgi:GAF domain-containing protein